VELRDYLYHYATDCFIDEVKSTICIENYTGEDADPKYVQYVERYNNIFESLFNKSDESILQGFIKIKENSCNNFNKFIIKKLHQTLSKNSNLSSETFDKIKVNLLQHLDTERVNVDLLHMIREIEEEFLK
jgi:hypothetical protein